MALSTFIKFHSKYEERFDYTIEHYEPFDRDKTTYKLYDKYGVVICGGLDRGGADRAKFVSNSEEKQYLESIYDYVTADLYNLQQKSQRSAGSFFQYN